MEDMEKRFVANPYLRRLTLREQITGGKYYYLAMLVKESFCVQVYVYMWGGIPSRCA